MDEPAAKPTRYDMEAAELFVTSQERAPQETQALERAEADVRECLQLMEGGKELTLVPPRLMFGDGRQVEPSQRVLQALQFVLHRMARGDAIGLVPENKMLSTTEAAQVLNVSRPFLVGLLHEGKIRFTMVGSHHRVRMGDVIAYKQQRDRHTLDMLDALAREAQEARNYFE